MIGSRRVVLPDGMRPASIQVRKGVIAAVGPYDSPHGKDYGDLVIMPGLVDVHAHMWPQWGIHSPQPYMYTVNLAYGVTTTRESSST